MVANYGSLWRGCWVKYYSLQEAGQVNLLFTTIKHSLTQMWLLFPLKFVSATLFLIGTVCWEWLCVWSTISVRVTGFHCMQAVGRHSGAFGEFLLARRWARKKQRDGIYTVHSKFSKNDHAFEVQPLAPFLHSLPVQRMKWNLRSQGWVSVPEKAQKMACTEKQMLWFGILHRFTSQEKGKAPLMIEIETF